MIQQNTAINIYNLSDDYVSRSVIMNQDSFQWVCKSYLFYIKPQTTVLEKASSSPFKVFPKGLFPSYLEHQSES